MIDYTIFSRGRTIPIHGRPLMMGIVNITPDSFFDGGRYLSVDRAVAQADALVEEGADILDLGAESTRPGAVPVGEQEEMDRLLPVLSEVVKRTAVPISWRRRSGGTIVAPPGLVETTRPYSIRG